MDTQLFSPLFGGITNTPSTVESPQLYSSWSTCEDENCVSAVASLQDCTKQRYGLIAILWRFLKIPLTGMMAAEFLDIKFYILAAHLRFCNGLR